MTALILLDLVATVLAAAMYWLLPDLVESALPFGVRVPLDRGGDPAILSARKRYRINTVALALLFLALGIAIGAAFHGSPLVLAVSLPVLLLLLHGDYYVEHRALRAVKNREGWYRDKVPGSAAELLPRGSQPAVSWLWALLAAVVVLATAVVGILRYGSLPQRIPIHFSAAGTPDSFAGKSLGSAFFLVLTQVILTGLMVALVLAIQHQESGLDPGDPTGSALRHRIFRRWMGVGMLTLAAGADLTLMLAAFMTWRLAKFSDSSEVLCLLPTLAGAAVVVVLAMRSGQQGAQLHLSHPPRGTTSLVPRDDDRYWHGAAFYVNRGDPAILVPKRAGVGWTVNFGHPLSWILLAAIVALAALPGLLLGH